ncbi:MAG: hypothetical protein GKS01_08560 [Alphaproteobacteria bacterium]|nr:hypothetical protein [Alphaproteobacteria bacterium]
MAVATSALIDSVVWILVGIVILLGAFLAAWSYPTAPFLVSVGLLLYLLLLLKYPSAWLIVIPAAIPLLELGFWSGQVYFTEFDLVLLVTIGGVLCRRRISFDGMSGPLVLTAYVLFFYSVFATWTGLFPFYAGGLGMFNDQLSSLNSLRESKGFLAAFFLLPILWAEARRGTNIHHLFAIGMIVGSVFAGATIVWERLLFTDLMNFTNAYRVSGMFFGTLTGGAAIDAYLMLSAPFLGALVLYRPGYLKSLLAFGVMMLAAYCVYVTYSRANYPATLAAISVFVLGVWFVTPWRLSLRPRVIVAGTVVCTVFAGAAYHLLIGTTISKRFAQTKEDMQTRIDHWSDAVRIVSTVPSGHWTGAGRGTFPLKYYVDSIAAKKRLVAPALTHTDSESFVTLIPGIDAGITYLRQRLNVSESNKYRLQLRVRGGENSHEILIIEFCERHVLNFLPECVWRQIAIPESSKDWRTFDVAVNLGHIGKEIYGLTWRKLGQFTRPVDIAILNRGVRERIDIASIGLVDSDGSQILRNGSFDNDLDHWFMSYGDHLRWHIKNIFVYTYFEGGILGLVVFTLVLALVSYQLLRRIVVDRDGFAVLYASALAGIVFIGLFDSLFDEPRITLLITLLVWLALIPSPVSPPTKEAVDDS